MLPLYKFTGCLQSEILMLSLQALILIMAIEGICLALFPGATRKTLLELACQPESPLRAVGVAALAGAIVGACLISYLQVSRQYGCRRFLLLA